MEKCLCFYQYNPQKHRRGTIPEEFDKTISSKLILHIKESSEACAMKGKIVEESGDKDSSKPLT
jgi:hypothetical protein